MKPKDLLIAISSRPDLSGNPLHAFMKAGIQHLVTMSIVRKNLPPPTSRITQSGHNDKYGVLLAQSDHDTAEAPSST